MTNCCDTYFEDIRFRISVLREQANVLYEIGWYGREFGYKPPTGQFDKQRYLSLIYCVNGKRVVRYIGCDRLAVKDAIDMLARHRRYFEIQDEIDKLERLLNDAELNLFFIEKRLKQVLSNQ